MQNNNSNYDENSIQILEGLKGVRKRPAMYIGSTDSKGLLHLVWEILDNSVDEVIAGFCNEIRLKINQNGSITISDNGRGIPVGLHKIGISTPELIFSRLHSGGKFGNGGYKSSGGLHGVGSSVVNALSKEFNVEIYRDGFIWSINFKNGGKLQKKITKMGTTKLTGTKITFLPDSTIFKNIHFSKFHIISHLKESAYLNPNLKIYFTSKTNKTELFHFPNGLSSFLTDLNENKTSITNVIKYKDSVNDVKISIAFQYTNEFSDIILSFANNIKTIDGGTHEIGFKTGITRAISDYVKQTNLLKNGTKIECQDIKEGLSAIISVIIPEKYIEYKGQTKSKLSTTIVKKIVEDLTYHNILCWLQTNSNTAKLIINKVLLAKKAREESKKVKQMIRMSKSSKNDRVKLLSGKLVPANSKIKSECELFLVEGDSAGGSAKLGRNRHFQAILPLKGKIMNVMKSSEMDILSNIEIQTIINAIGIKINTDFNPENINYGKIIIMTDADNDGAHIQILLLSFFYKYMFKLFLHKKIYVALPPLYRLIFKKDNKYFWDDTTLNQYISDNKILKYDIQRYKGLGEMDSDQLWETTMNPEKRTLLQVTIEDAYIANNIIDTLMGNNPSKRKDWIQENIDFNNDKDAFFDKVKRKLF